MRSAAIARCFDDQHARPVRPPASKANRTTDDEGANTVNRSQPTASVIAAPPPAKSADPVHDAARENPRSLPPSSWPRADGRPVQRKPKQAAFR